MVSHSATVKGSQAITFTSTEPSPATVGGPTYTVTATGGASGNPVTFAIDAASSSVCSIAGSAVSFTAAGTCTIDANQAGNANYTAAPQVQQSFAVAPAPTVAPVLPPVLPPVPPIVSTPNSNFSAHVAAVKPTNAITFTLTVSDPGTLTWLFTFQNGKFGVFASKHTKCKSGLVKLNGRCRPSKIVFARGSKIVAGAGSTSFTVKPSASALKALKNAFNHKKGLPVTEMFSYQSSGGGGPVSRVQSLIVKLSKR
jgi:hypothetical protein